MSFLTPNNVFAQTVSSIGNFKIKGEKVGSIPKMVSYAKLSKKEFLITQEKFDDNKKATDLIISTIPVKKIRRIGSESAYVGEECWITIETLTENDIKVKTQASTDKTFKDETIGFVAVYFASPKDMDKFVEEIKKYYKK
jgi:hypothetical protein